MSSSMSPAARSDVRLVAVARGGVHGVGYRYFARSQARALGLRGYARNQADGTVEVVAEGPRPSLEHLLAALRRGPAAADVREVATQWLPAERIFDNFTIRH